MREEASCVASERESQHKQRSRTNSGVVLFFFRQRCQGQPGWSTRGASGPQGSFLAIMAFSRIAIVASEREIAKFRKIAFG